MGGAGQVACVRVVWIAVLDSFGGGLSCLRQGAGGRVSVLPLVRAPLTEPVAAPAAKERKAVPHPRHWRALRGSV